MSRNYLNVLFVFKDNHVIYFSILSNINYRTNHMLSSKTLMAIGLLF